MRIRTVKPEFFTHERLFDAEAETGLPLRLSFVGLWCAADREGRFKWEPRRLGVHILPYDGIDFSRVLDALATRGFVVKYASEGRIYGCIPSFGEHQVINNREKESAIPNPPSINDSDACPTRDPRVTHATLSCTSGKEGNMEHGKEGVLSPLSSEETRKPIDLESMDPIQRIKHHIPAGAERWSASRQKQTRMTDTTPLLSRIGSFLGRRPTTLWTVADALKVVNLNPQPDELDEIEEFYKAHIPKDDYRRTSIETLLNNWNGEGDKARLWKAENK